MGSDLTIVTTCKGRLAHLRETLPRMVAQSNTRCIVVDYGCPQKCGEWVAEYWPAVKVIRVEDDPGFCASRARNIGAQHADGDWLAFVDADIRLHQNFSEEIRHKFMPRHHLLPSPATMETYGTFVCEREVFNQIKGYDEAFRSWGGEDEELYLRLRMSGNHQSGFPGALVEVISHDDSLRTTYYAEKSRNEAVMVSTLYAAAKLDLMVLTQSPLPLETRHQLFAEARKAVATSKTNGFSSAPVLTIAQEVPFPNLHHFGLKLHRNLQYSLSRRADTNLI